MNRLTRLLLVSLVFLGCTAGQAIAAGKGVVLITGANRGIGLALAREFSSHGYTVIGTARSPGKATELKALGARVERLDVADPDSVEALAKRLDGESVDILVNNAGIIGHDAGTLAELDVEKLDTVISVNTLGPLRVTQALMPALEAGDGRTVVNISSMMGSMELNTWGCCLGYRASKAALNSISRTLALDFADRNMVFVVLHPGYVQTDMNEGKGHITALQSAQGLFGVITGLDRDDNGGFFDYQGKPMPW